MTPSHSSPLLACAVALAVAGAAFAQGTPSPPIAPQAPAPPQAAAPPQAPPPPKLEPLPEIPRPPGVASDADLEPQVTIKSRGGDTVEEARVNGRLVWIKVTPRHGRPYFLVPDGAGNVALRRDSHDSGLSIPLWVLLEF
jgi:hypothetical protein